MSGNKKFMNIKMSKKILIVILSIIVTIVVAYFILVGVFKVTGVCPTYVNLMPIPVAPGEESRTRSDGPRSWHKIFCPFLQKVY